MRGLFKMELPLPLSLNKGRARQPQTHHGGHVSLSTIVSTPLTLHQLVQDLASVRGRSQSWLRLSMNEHTPHRQSHLQLLLLEEQRERREISSKSGGSVPGGLRAEVPGLRSSGTVCYV